MVKFVVVLYRRAETTHPQFRHYFESVHRPLAEALPGLRRYMRNYPRQDPRRDPPRWDAVVELWWNDRPTMEAAWESSEGRAATADLVRFADLTRSSWGVVEERGVRGGDHRATRSARRSKEPSR